MIRGLAAIAALLIAACGMSPSMGASTPVATLSPPAVTIRDSPTAVPASAIPTESVSALPTASATPDPFAAYFIATLRARSYPGGSITIVQTLEKTTAFTRTLIAYPSDGLTITGMMNVPVGSGPFPVIILNHGHFDPAEYTTGRGTQTAADYFARHGYLTLAPDFRGYAGSDPGENYFRLGYAIDVMNLIASVKSLPQANADSIGLWGHSMGGGVTIALLTLNPPGVRGAVLLAPMNADAAIDYYRIAYFRGQPTPGPEWPVPPPDAPDLYAHVSPINYLSNVSVPVLIHHGDADTTVPPEWSAQLQAALTAAGKQATLYSYPGAGHSFYNSDWLLFMKRNAEFFDKLLK